MLSSIIFHATILHLGAACHFLIPHSRLNTAHVWDHRMYREWSCSFLGCVSQEAAGGPRVLYPRLGMEWGSGGEQHKKGTCSLNKIQLHNWLEENNALGSIYKKKLLVIFTQMWQSLIEFCFIGWLPMIIITISWPQCGIFPIEVFQENDRIMATRRSWRSKEINVFIKLQSKFVSWYSAIKIF